MQMLEISAQQDYHMSQNSLFAPAAKRQLNIFMTGNPQVTHRQSEHMRAITAEKQ